MLRSENVLVITGPATVGGSMTSDGGQGIGGALRRQMQIMTASSGIWLDMSLKAVSAELLAAKSLFGRSSKYANAPYRNAVESYFEAQNYFDSPELTEIVITGLLRDAGLDFKVTTYSSLTDPAKREALLAETTCVLMSSTLMRDLSELDPLARMLKRPHNRIVVGGALTSLVHHQWPGHPDVDVVAVGYGELLVPVLCDWIKSGYERLDAPPGGLVVESNGNLMLYSGNPADKSLDWIPTPDWEHAENYSDRKFELVHYESVRGCPYRCAFCNYPFLFDDKTFRTKSARRIADDWIHYASHGAKIVNCLDSLFTIPPKRLEELCGILIAEGNPIEWICYARAGDLAKPGTALMMKKAGCRMVHVGYESGSQTILDNMNKRSGVRENRIGMANCREAGLTTAATLIVGFPGESEDSLRATVECLRESPPDLFFGGAFNTRMEAMPVLQPEKREQFGLVTVADHRSSAPYWRHDTMSCDRAAGSLRWLNQTLIEERIALEGSLFYQGLMGFQPEDRDALLNYQADLLSHHGWLRTGGAVAQSVLSSMVRWDSRRKLPEDTASSTAA